MCMNSRHIEDDGVLISRRIYQLIPLDDRDDRDLVRCDWGLHGKNSGEHVNLIFKKRITHSWQEVYAATGCSLPQGISIPRPIKRLTVMIGARREAPPSDPAAFNAWIVALFLQNIDTTYTVERPIGTGFNDGRPFVPREQAAVVDRSSRSSLLRIQSPVVATTVPSWLSNGELSVMSRVHTFQSRSKQAYENSKKTLRKVGVIEGAAASSKLGCDDGGSGGVEGKNRE
ncbi:hypothetical protein EDD18DRAFT_1113109 [Armillaria luteobubalina]|uniref:Uncharacterized protein n=1 Tax=Armillaria luteobubalina TaxID=153913 RepID=A0AA39PC17_9AGAR|nr:hypothetical protein EDD18DRAFT_1113109 [Armillaria luteobubalina]